MTGQTLIGGERPDCLEDVRRAGQDDFLEDRRVRHRTIERRHPLHGCVEVLEQFVGNPCRDLRAKAAGELILVRDDDAVRSLRVCGDRVYAAIVSQSYGMIDRRSTTATLIPSFSACCAASSDRCTSAPQVKTTTSVPSRATAALPKGIM
jgi:hypothetical protein